MANIATRKRDPYVKYRYRVVFEGYPQIGFQEVSGLEDESGVIEYREGDDSPTPRKQPGLTRYTDVVCKRGLDLDNTLQAIRNLVVETDGPNFGDGVSEYRINCMIYLLDKQHKPAKTWKVYNAWARMKSIDAFNANSEEPAIETLTLVNEGQRKVQG